MSMVSQKEVERMAQRAGKTPEQYCLDRITEYEALLSQYRDDCLALSEEEFERRLEDET